MRSNYGQIADLVGLVLRSGVRGDFVELGVWQGTTFLPLAEAAAAAGRTCHAVDSFEGCAPAGERDVDEDGRVQYPAGALSVGGPRLFQQLVRPLADTVRIWQGWVPAVLEKVQAPVLAFAHVDLDQYSPTLDALRWCWERLSPGGIVCCHDWFPGRRCLAAGGFNDWLKELGVEVRPGAWIVAGSEGHSAGIAPGNHAWLRKAR